MTAVTAAGGIAETAWGLHNRRKEDAVSDAELTRETSDDQVQGSSGPPADAGTHPHRPLAPATSIEAHSTASKIERQTDERGDDGPVSETSHSSTVVNHGSLQGTWRSQPPGRQSSWETAILIWARTHMPHP